MPRGELGGQNFFQNPTVGELAPDFAGDELSEDGLAEDVPERELAVKEPTSRGLY